MRRFQTLGELISLYAQPNQGLVCSAAARERELQSRTRRMTVMPQVLPGCHVPSCPHRTSPGDFLPHLLNLPPLKPPATLPGAWAIYSLHGSP